MSSVFQLGEGPRQKPAKAIHLTHKLNSKLYVIPSKRRNFYNFLKLGPVGIYVMNIRKIQQEMGVPVLFFAQHGWLTVTIRPARFPLEP